MIDLQKLWKPQDFTGNVYHATECVLKQAFVRCPVVVFLKVGTVVKKSLQFLSNQINPKKLSKYPLVGCKRGTHSIIITFVIFFEARTFKKEIP